NEAGLAETDKGNRRAGSVRAARHFRLWYPLARALTECKCYLQVDAPRFGALTEGHGPVNRAAEQRWQRENQAYERRRRAEHRTRGPGRGGRAWRLRGCHGARGPGPYRA